MKLFSQFIIICTTTQNLCLFKDSYEKGRKKATLAEETDNLESEDNIGRLRKRYPTAQNEDCASDEGNRSKRKCTTYSTKEKKQRNPKSRLALQEERSSVPLSLTHLQSPWDHTRRNY